MVVTVPTKLLVVSIRIEPPVVNSGTVTLIVSSSVHPPVLVTSTRTELVLLKLVVKVLTGPL